MLAADLQDPVTYSWWVPALGWAGVALVAAWIAGVLWMTRPRAEEAGTVRALPPLGADRFAEVRAAHLARVDEVERRHLSGELDLRGLHQELSAVVRDFATVRRGVDTRVLTLSDLRRTESTRHLAGLIETYYRPAFAAESVASADVAVAGARQVISQW